MDGTRDPYADAAVRNTEPLSGVLCCHSGSGDTPGANKREYSALLSRASQIVGSNCVPRYLSSSFLTESASKAALYGRSVVIASMVSANMIMRDPSGIASAFNPSG